MMIDRERVLSALRAKREEVEARYGLRMIGIIGSVARGEAKAASDVDVFVDVTRTPSLFEISRAERDVQAAPGVGLPVDFVFREDLRPSLRSRMERDLIAL
jgi:predicted nucleotidyltransferase